MTDPFGKVRLAHVVVESQHLSDWRRFAGDAIGMHVDQPDGDILTARLDEHRCRFLVRRGTAEDVTALGWQLADESTLGEVVDRLRAQGIVTREALDHEAQVRGVEQLVTGVGPKGLVMELFVDAKPAEDPLRVAGSGFVTGDLGMGHVAITTRHPESLVGFAQRTFGARLSDQIDARMSGVDLQITFLRMNPRHHTLAVAETKRVRLDPIRTRVQHVNVQVAALDDMTEAYVRCRQLGFRIAMGVGQHTNDRELSFYAVTPSGFELETGWNPITVDESTWHPGRLEGISIWGHRPQEQTLADKVGQFRQGALSLLRDEATVPVLAPGAP